MRKIKPSEVRPSRSFCPEPFSHSAAYTRSARAQQALNRALRDHREALDTYASTNPTSPDFPMAIAALDEANGNLTQAHQNFLLVSKGI